MNNIDSIIQEATESSVPSKPKQSKLEKISKEIQKEIVSYDRKTFGIRGQVAGV